MKKFLSIFSLVVVIFAAMFTQAAFAGGSSYSWQSVAHDAVLTPGGMGPDGSLLMVTVSNYFADKRALKVNKLEVICVGSRIMDSANLYDQSTGDFFDNVKFKNYRGYQLVRFTPATNVSVSKDVVFNVNFIAKKNAQVGSFAHCAINKMKIADANTGEAMFTGPGSYGVNETNDASTIIIGTADDNE